jgi:hypothetical protein
VETVIQELNNTISSIPLITWTNQIVHHLAVMGHTITCLIHFFNWDVVLQYY